MVLPEMEEKMTTSLHYFLTQSEPHLLDFPDFLKDSVVGMKYLNIHLKQER